MSSSRGDQRGVEGGARPSRRREGRGRRMKEEKASGRGREEDGGRGRRVRGRAEEGAGPAGVVARLEAARPGGRGAPLSRAGPGEARGSGHPGRDGATPPAAHRRIAASEFRAGPPGCGSGAHPRPDPGRPGGDLLHRPAERGRRQDDLAKIPEPIEPGVSPFGKERKNVRGRVETTGQKATTSTPEQGSTPSPALASSSMIGHYKATGDLDDIDPGRGHNAIALARTSSSTRDHLRRCVDESHAVTPGDSRTRRPSCGPR